ncbi:hypothetical protein GCM10028796_32970 [Ramlibacter monticola]
MTASACGAQCVGSIKAGSAGPMGIIGRPLTAMLDPGAGKTKRAYVWAYARGEFDPTPAVVTCSPPAVTSR